MGFASLRMTQSFLRLDMEGDVGLLAILLAEVALDLSRQLMGGPDGHVAIHPDMRLDGDVVANVAGTQVVGRADTRCLTDDSEDLLLHLLGQGFLQEVVDGGNDQLQSHLHDQKTDDFFICL